MEEIEQLFVAYLHLNLEKYDEWKDDPDMINDVMRFLDNVLTDFIKKAPDQFKDAKYSAERERSVGLV